MIKLEIDKKNLSILEYLVKKKINVIAHIGVKTQDFKDLKIKAVGKNDNEYKELLDIALKSENAGAKALLLECVTQKLQKNNVFSFYTNNRYRFIKILWWTSSCLWWFDKYG